MSPILILLLFSNITYSICHLQHHQKLLIEKRSIGVIQNDPPKDEPKPVPKVEKEEIPTINVKVPNKDQSVQTVQVHPVEEHKDKKENATISSTKSPEHTSKIKPTEMETGALFRGVLVFVGFSFLFILYLAFKTYYRRRSNSQPVMVRKYGVRTRRSDIEMTPLPLSDDEDDETVFELSGNAPR